MIIDLFSFEKERANLANLSLIELAVNSVPSFFILYQSLRSHRCTCSRFFFFYDKYPDR